MYRSELTFRRVSRLFSQGNTIFTSDEGRGTEPPPRFTLRPVAALVFVIFGIALCVAVVRAGVGGGVGQAVSALAPIAAAIFVATLFWAAGYVIPLTLYRAVKQKSLGEVVYPVLVGTEQDPEFQAIPGSGGWRRPRSHYLCISIDDRSLRVWYPARYPQNIVTIELSQIVEVEYAQVLYSTGKFPALRISWVDAIGQPYSLRIAVCRAVGPFIFPGSAGQLVGVRERLCEPRRRPR